MFIELTDGDGRRFLVNPERIIVAYEQVGELKSSLVIEGAKTPVSTCQDIDEIKKRLGISITPRAETIARP